MGHTLLIENRCVETQLWLESPYVGHVWDSECGKNSALYGRKTANIPFLRPGTIHWPLMALKNAKWHSRRGKIKNIFFFNSTP